MADADGERDSVAFIMGSRNDTKYEQMSDGDQTGVRTLVCSPKRAALVAILTAAVILTVAFVAAFSQPTVEVCRRTLPANVSVPTTQLPMTEDGVLFPWNSYRLPQQVRPKLYDLQVRIHLGPEFHFYGNISITIDAPEKTNLIVLHSTNLTLTHYSVRSLKHGGRIRVVQMLEYKPRQMVSFRLARGLQLSESVELRIEFNAPLVDKLSGLYRSTYNDSADAHHYIATTQFEPTSAREAFPCFDEPNFKAVFQIRIEHDSRFIALSNEPVEHTENTTDGMTADAFKATPAMSTYLVAMIVCDFKAKTTKVEHKLDASEAVTVTDIAVYAPLEKIDQVDFALDITGKILSRYHDFFQIPYQLPKLDLIAIPDFKAGAMENWGLITYRETAILYNPGVSSVSAQQRVAIVVAHELAHQWFGNLVTMDWWNDLWLNEGFASFVEYIGSSFVKPEWEMMTQFFVKQTRYALHTDALASSHPISVEVHDSDEVESLFDDISYQKGAALISMVQSFLSEKVLKDGLTKYLTNHEFQNANTGDLWKALNISASENGMSEINVPHIMQTWTEQMGYPVLTISFDRANGKLRVHQQRFLLNRDTAENFTMPGDESRLGYVWDVPLTYITDQNEMKQLWINRHLNTVFHISPIPRWIKANVNQTGYYRVKYDTLNWETLIELLWKNHTALSSLDRAGLIDDAFSLQFGAELAPKIALNLSMYLKSERDYAPWETVRYHLEILLLLTNDKPVYKNLKKYILGIVSPALKYVKWTDTGSHLEKLLRTTILKLACLVEHPECEKETLEMYRLWMDNATSVPPNLRSVVYSNAMKYGGEEEWQFAWEQYRSTTVASEKKLLLVALTASKNVWQMTQMLRYSLNAEFIRPQDMQYVIMGVGMNPLTRWHAWRFLCSNWQAIIRIGGRGAGFARMLKTVTRHFSSEFDYKQLSEFFDLKKEAGRASYQVLETVRHNVDWMLNSRGELLLESWLESNV